jgi:hypothetical protein
VAHAAGPARRAGARTASSARPARASDRRTPTKWRATASQLYEVRDEAIPRASRTSSRRRTRSSSASATRRSTRHRSRTACLRAAATLGDRIADTLPLVERAVRTDARVLLEDSSARCGISTGASTRTSRPPIRSPGRRGGCGHPAALHHASSVS